MGPVASFLDVALDLSGGACGAFGRPSGALVCIGAAGGHPPSVLGRIPGMVEGRLKGISCSEAVFNGARPLCGDVLGRG